MISDFEFRTSNFSFERQRNGIARVGGWKSEIRISKFEIDVQPRHEQ